MTNLTPKEAALIRPYIKRFLDLVEGRREPETDAQRYFLECAHGRREPVTPYEIAFSKWQKDKPDLSALVAFEVPSPCNAAKKRRKEKPKRGMSAAKAKKQSDARWTPEEIEAHHKKSGFYRYKLKVVQGGRVNPR